VILIAQYFQQLNDPEQVLEFSFGCSVNNNNSRFKYYGVRMV
jgi:hypothetical protein